MTLRDSAPAEKNQAETFKAHDESVATKMLADLSDFTVTAKDSFLYSAIQSPLTGVSQLIDQIADSHVTDSVQLFAAPAEAKFGSAAWHAQQIGSGLGIAADFLVAKKVVGVSADRLAASSTTVLDAASEISTISARSAITRSAVAGAIYQGVFSPSTTNSTDFLQARLSNAATGALTFETLTGASLGLKSAVGTAAEGSSYVTRALKSEFLTGVAAGIPAGIMSAESSSLLNGNGLATAGQTLQSTYGFLVAGGTPGLAHACAGAAREGATAKVIRAASETRTDPDAPPAIPVPDRVGPYLLAERVSETELAASRLTGTQWGSLKLQWKTFDKLDIGARKVDATRDSLDEIASERRDVLTLKRHSSTDDSVIEVTTPSTVITLRGHNTEIVIPDGQWHDLEGVRAWRQYASDLPPDQKKDFDALMKKSGRQQLKQGSAGVDGSIANYSSAILPEQLGQFLDELPDKSLVRRIVIWPDGGFKTAADAGNSTINIYRMGRLDANDIRHFLFHEWSHLGDDKSTSSMFTYAADLEDGQYYAREYAKKNRQENLAVHLGEEFLSPDADDFFTLAQRAPLRTFALSELLKERLSHAETAEAQSIYARQFAARVSYVDENVVPVARMTLSTHLDGDYNNQMKSLLLLSQFSDYDSERAQRMVDIRQLQKIASISESEGEPNEPMTREEFDDLLHAAKSRLWLVNHPEDTGRLSAVH